MPGRTLPRVTLQIVVESKHTMRWKGRFTRRRAPRDCAISIGDSSVELYETGSFAVIVLIPVGVGLCFAGIGVRVIAAGFDPMAAVLLIGGLGAFATAAVLACQRIQVTFETTSGVVVFSCKTLGRVKRLGSWRLSECRLTTHEVVLVSRELIPAWHGHCAVLHMGTSSDRSGRRMVVTVRRRRDDVEAHLSMWRTRVGLGSPEGGPTIVARR